MTWTCGIAMTTWVKPEIGGPRLRPHQRVSERGDRRLLGRKTSAWPLNKGVLFRSPRRADQARPQRPTTSTPHLGRHFQATNKNEPALRRCTKSQGRRLAGKSRSGCFDELRNSGWARAWSPHLTAPATDGPRHLLSARRLKGWLLRNESLRGYSLLAPTFWSFSY